MDVESTKSIAKLVLKKGEHMKNQSFSGDLQNRSFDSLPKENSIQELGRMARINNYPAMEMGKGEIDEDLFKLDKLSYINASARYELMSAKE